MVGWAVLGSKVTLLLSHLSTASRLLKTGGPLNQPGAEPDAETARHTARLKSSCLAAVGCDPRVSHLHVVSTALHCS